MSAARRLAASRSPGRWDSIRGEMPATASANSLKQRTRQGRVEDRRRLGPLGMRGAWVTRSGIVGLRDQLREELGGLRWRITI